MTLDEWLALAERVVSQGLVVMDDQRRTIAKLREALLWVVPSEPETCTWCRTSLQNEQLYCPPHRALQETAS